MSVSIISMVDRKSSNRTPPCKRGENTTVNQKKASSDEVVSVFFSKSPLAPLLLNCRWRKNLYGTKAKWATS
jgi:hypothetical protein